MGINILVTLIRKVKNLERESSIAKMEINILETGNKTILMGKEFMPLIQDKFSREL